MIFIFLKRRVFTLVVVLMPLLGCADQSLEFDPIDVPIGRDQEHFQFTRSVYANGVLQKLSFTPLIKTGDKDNGEIFGAVKDYKDRLIMFRDGSPYVCNGTNDGVGSGLDFSSLIQKNTKLFLVSQFECSIGAMYMLQLEQNNTTGAISTKPNTLQFISQKGEFGGFTHCAGQTTPWQSHLSSEEYEPNARDIEKGKKHTPYDETLKFWEGDKSKNNPYYYGWIPEVTINANDKPIYSKHYAMGRISHELAYVMPDKKTVYMSDDGDNVGIFMFIADKTEDLSAGTLYAAKLTQINADRGGSFDLEWINLGHATDASIRTKIEQTPRFSDIFDAQEPSRNNQCTEGYSVVNTSFGAECLRVKKGMEIYASRLETRRFAAILGATTELRKEEGVTYDPIHNKLYIAISEISRGMEDHKHYDKEDERFDRGGYNHIRLPYNKCGGVYELNLNGHRKDSKGFLISSFYVASDFNAILTGIPTNYAKTEFEGNSCSVEGIASPDNISYIPNSDILIIGEDTDSHVNNFVWAYNVKTGDIRRIMTLPLGAEATSTNWETVNGFSYLSIVIQHPKTRDGESFFGVLGPIMHE